MSTIIDWERMRDRLLEAAPTDTAKLDARYALLMCEEYLSLRARCEALSREVESQHKISSAALARASALEDFCKELAAEGCEYGDDCVPFSQNRHGVCLPCKARLALKGS